MAVASEKEMSLAILPAKTEEEKPEEQLEESKYKVCRGNYKISMPKEVSELQGSLFQIERKGNYYIVKEKLVRCCITGKIVRSTLALRPVEVFILNTSTFLLQSHPRHKLPTCGAFQVEFVSTSGIIRTFGKNFWIVPRLFKKKMPASATSRYLAAKFCSLRLHKYAMSELIRYMGANVRYWDYVHSASNFTMNDASKEYVTINGPPISDYYQSKEKLFYSVEGLLQLVEQGVMDIGQIGIQKKCKCSDCKHSSRIVALTHDSFTHIYPNGCRANINGYYNMERMINERELFLNMMKLAQ